MYPYIHSNNIIIDDMPYKSLFNGLFTGIFLKYFDSSYGDDHYFLMTILP
jgi:hypothetical protein